MDIHVNTASQHEHMLPRIETVSFESIKSELHQRRNTDTPEVTIVTAYINIGSFGKGGNGMHMRTSSFYEDLMTAYRNIHNPVVAFFDKGDPIADEFSKLRQHLTVNTTVVQIDREDFWSFRIRENVSRIFSNPEYPKFFPNTVVPEYACTTTAKFEFVQYVIKHHMYSTEYISWVDFGYWRWNIPENSQVFIPPAFKTDMIAFGLSRLPRQTNDYHDIIYHNINWVGGGIFLGTIRLMKEFMDIYLENTNYFLARGYMATEQQMLHAMINCNEIPRSMPPILTYAHSIDSNFSSKWLYLGWLCLQ